MAEQWTFNPWVQGSNPWRPTIRDIRNHPAVAGGTRLEKSSYLLHQGDALDAYESWPTPAAIISDGAYGVRGFPGDTTGTGQLADWYRPHVEAWTRLATAATTLWFWNTEVGWATVHPLLADHGWEYVQSITWDKGIGHVAGNVNGQTIRRFPVTTEICVFYQRRLEIAGPDGAMGVQQWMRHEWQRTGLPLSPANHGCASGRPYYSLDGLGPVSAKEWDGLRHRWRHAHGLTNVWRLAPLHGVERVKGTMRRAAPRVYNPRRSSAAHLNQKPLEFMHRILNAVTDPGDVIWEPFGGLASASVAAVQAGRVPCVAELDPGFALLAAQRLIDAHHTELG